MKKHGENHRRDLTLTEDCNYWVELFPSVKQKITRESFELKQAKWDLWVFFERFLRLAYELERRQLYALEDLAAKDTKKNREALSEINALIEMSKSSRPFLLDLFLVARKVRDQIGSNCAVDIAEAANKYKLPKVGSGKITTNQVISMLNRFAILGKNQTVECQEKEALIFRFYLGCIHILRATTAETAYKNDILLKKRQGGNFVGILSRFAQKRDTQEFLRRLESIKRLVNKSALTEEEMLSDEEITTATVHCLELTTTFLGSLSERKKIQHKFGLPFTIDDEIAILKVHVGEKWAKNAPLSGRVINDYVHSVQKE